MEETIIQLEIPQEDSYHVRLENFEGPLDLLLHLIKEAKMDELNKNAFNKINPKFD